MVNYIVDSISEEPFIIYHIENGVLVKLCCIFSLCRIVANAELRLYDESARFYRVALFALPIQDLCSHIIMF